jgi:N-methylhydantoinase A
VQVRRTIDARYRGQSYELNVPAEADWVERFHAAHARRFGHARPGSLVEAVTLRVEAAAPPPLAEADIAFAPDALRLEPQRTRLVWCNRLVDATLLARSQAVAGLEGPAVLVEYSATTFLPPGWRVEGVSAGSLVLAGSGAATA